MLVLICTLMVLWLAASNLAMQRALRWWFGRQSEQFFCRSNQIQNGVIQELFAARRHLELSLANESQDVTQRQEWLNRTEVIHRSIEQFSDFLAPPYLAESLPLALKSMMADWQLEHPSWTVNIELPTDWQEETPERNRIILAIVEELLRITAPIAITGASLTLCLHAQSYGGDLMIQIEYPSASALKSVMQTQEVAHLRRTFQCLASGRCFYRRHDRYITWHFQWK